MEGKKRAETGGLKSNLIVTENAFIRLTSNIDVTDGLANGVRGIIQKLITNDEGSLSVILVKFDDETVREKAKVLSQYSEQYPDAVPIFRHGIPFQHKNATIFCSQCPLILAWASTIQSVQGLTVDKIVVALSKIFAAGQEYVAMSQVRTLQGLQILNYKTNQHYQKRQESTKGDDKATIKSNHIQLASDSHITTGTLDKDMSLECQKISQSYQ